MTILSALRHGLTGLGLFISVGCSSNSSVDAAPESGGGTPAVTAADLSDATWIPNVSGSGVSNRKLTASNTTSTVEVAAAPLITLEQPWSASKEVTVSLGTYSASDFDAMGSLSLIAKVSDYPFSSGGAFPVLIALQVDTGSGVIDYVKTLRNGTASDCRASGMFVCDSSGSCASNPSCTVDTGSSFASRRDWQQNQIPIFGYESVNVFPRCDQANSVWSASDCPTEISGPLRSGAYTAKYVLLSDRTGSVSGYTATLSVQAIVKKDTDTRASGLPGKGAIDLNVILMGAQTIADSKTARGQQNLNLLFTEVQTVLNSAVGVKLGSINAYEWADGEANPDIDTLGNVFQSGTLGLPAARQSGAATIFIVSSIPYSTPGTTILGLSGAIGGSYVGGTQASGLAFSSFDLLQDFNPLCATGNNCTRGQLENDFLEMGATIGHELGHYLGLNHPSERRSGGSQLHDRLPDTPQALARLSSGTYVLDQLACILDTTSTLSGATCVSVCSNYFVSGVPTNYCPSAQACQFNHLMWYTTKNRSLSGGTWSEDGSLISSQSGAMVQWHPLVR